LLYGILTTFSDTLRELFSLAQKSSSTFISHCVRHFVSIAEGEAKRAEERLSNAKALLDNGVPLEVIVNSLHLTEEETAALQG
jgi:hypothetical protein